MSSSDLEPARAGDAQTVYPPWWALPSRPQLAYWYGWLAGLPRGPTVAYGQFLRNMQDGDVASVVVRDATCTVVDRPEPRAPPMTPMRSRDPMAFAPHWARAR
jgi:hypothetical protein